ncbi:hypothetical protein D3C78_1444830 [compost metagenome]
MLLMLNIVNKEEQQIRIHFSGPFGNFLHPVNRFEHPLQMLLLPLQQLILLCQAVLKIGLGMT